MHELFNPDGKIMGYGMKFAYLMWLQILTFLCCLPVFTMGAAFTAMHKILLQIYRNEEVDITKTYFAAFASNFRQATVIWLGCLAMFVALYLDYRLTANAGDSLPLLALRYLLPVVLVLLLVGLSWVFVLLSRYQNSIIGTIRLSFSACIAHPLNTVFMVVLMLCPLLLMLLSWRLLPFVFLLGFTVPGILRAMLYSKVFDHLEDSDWRKQRAEEMLESDPDADES